MHDIFILFVKIQNRAAFGIRTTSEINSHNVDQLNLHLDVYRYDFKK